MNVYIVFTRGMEVKIAATETDISTSILYFYGFDDNIVAQFQEWDYWYLKKEGKIESQ